MAKKRGRTRRGRPGAPDQLRPVQLAKRPARGDGNFQRNARVLVRRVRRELALSQTAFGKLFGKSRDTVSRVERGELPVPPGLLPLLGALQKAERDRRQVLRDVMRGSRRLAWGE